MSDSFIEKTDRLLSEIDKELSNIYFSCTECSSPIELISYNEDKSTMEFKCLTEERHGKIKVGIKEYFEKIIKNKYQNEDEFKDNCKIHNSNNFSSFCFDCNQHLCKVCLKGRTHIKSNNRNTANSRRIGYCPRSDR